jgi:hypothetical protein
MGFAGEAILLGRKAERAGVGEKKFAGEVVRADFALLWERL